MSYKYLSDTQPSLQLSAFLLQGSNFLVFREQYIGMLGQVPSSLTGKCPLVLFNWPRSHQRWGIDLQRKYIFISRNVGIQSWRHMRYEWKLRGSTVVKRTGFSRILSKSHSCLQECSCGILVLALVAHWFINRQRPAKDSTKPISSSAVFVGVVLPQLIYIFGHGSALELSHPLMHIHRKSGSMSYMWSAMWMHKRVSADLSTDLNWHWDELIYHDYVWRWCHGLSDYSNSNSG